MLFKLTSSFTSLSFVLTVLLAATVSESYGQKPEPVLRTFMIYGTVSEGPDQFPDVASDASQFVVTHSGKNANGSSGPAVFGTANCDDEEDDVIFENTTWMFGSYITHVTSGGPKTYFVFWLDEIPPSGAMLYTGPDSLAITETAWQRTANSGECDTTNGNWIIERHATNDSYPVYIVTGLFSR